jgi:hypothetical protein
MTRSALGIGALILAGAALAPGQARAQGFAERTIVDDSEIESTEDLAWELLRIGPYEPAARSSAESFNDGDDGPLLTTELHYYLYRIPYVGPIAAGARVGWARYGGTARDTMGNPTGESTRLTIFPMTPLAALRIDVLAQEFNVPLVFVGKIGFDIVPWRIERGGQKVGNAVSLGVNWSAQVALELDFLEPRAARRLDEEWGINHAYLFFEIFGSNAGQQGADPPDVCLGGGADASSCTLDVGDGFSFAAGLGFII